jgi:pyridoxine 5-phosphate synthase
MTKLSVNINKIALIRNSRGTNKPDLLQVAADCERFGADGITVHPRPDERHVKYSDLQPLKNLVTSEFNIEGYPDERFLKKVIEVKPHQVTLVPDPPGALTSSAGWDTIKHKEMLTDIVKTLKQAGIRVSIFIEPVAELLEAAAATGTDRIEFYTEPYASMFDHDRAQAVRPYAAAAKVAHELGLGINAGHDLNLDNLSYLKQHIPHLLEVSIGHALICDALYFGLENTIQMYKRQLLT